MTAADGMGVDQLADEYVICVEEAVTVNDARDDAYLAAGGVGVSAGEAAEPCLWTALNATLALVPAVKPDNVGVAEVIYIGVPVSAEKSVHVAGGGDCSDFQKRYRMLNVKRGELYYADLSPVVGSEQGGVRPVLVVQNDVGNKYSPTIIAAAVTSKINKAKLPTHIELPSAYGLAKDSVILLEQIRTLDKRRLKERIGELPPATMVRVNRAILISLGFPVNS